MWVVRIEFADVSGVTLWSGDDADLLLASDHRLLLFTSTWQLRHFVLSGARSNLEQRAGYERLRSYLKGSSDRRLRIDDRTYSFPRLVRTLALGRVTQRNQSEVLDALNMLWDIVNTVEVRSARRILVSPRMRKLFDTLTFVELGGSRPMSEALDLSRAAQDVETVISHVRPSIDLLSAAVSPIAIAG